MPRMGLEMRNSGGVNVGARKAVGDLGGSLAVLESELERALGVRV